MEIPAGNYATMACHNEMDPNDEEEKIEHNTIDGVEALKQP